MAPISSSAATLVVVVLPLSGLSLKSVAVDVLSAPLRWRGPLTLATVIAWLMLDGWLTVTMVPAGIITVTGSRADDGADAGGATAVGHVCIDVPRPAPGTVPAADATHDRLERHRDDERLPTGMAPPSVTLVDVAAFWDPKEPTNPGVPIAAAAFPGQPRTTINAPETTRATTPSHDLPRSSIHYPSTTGRSFERRSPDGAKTPSHCHPGPLMAPDDLASLRAYSQRIVAPAPSSRVRQRSALQRAPAATFARTLLDRKEQPVVLVALRSLGFAPPRTPTP